MGDVHLTAQGLRLVAAGQLFQLGDQLVAFAQREEFTALHGVHQQLELRQLEIPAGHVVAAVLGLAVFHIQPPLPQGVYVIVKAFALGGDIMPGQVFHHLGDGGGVFLIGILQQKLPQIQAFELLVGGACHRVPPLGGFCPHSTTGRREIQWTKTHKGDNGGCLGQSQSRAPPPATR